MNQPFRRSCPVQKKKKKKAWNLVTLSSVYQNHLWCCKKKIIGAFHALHTPFDLIGLEVAQASIIFKAPGWLTGGQGWSTVLYKSQRLRLFKTFKANKALSRGGNHLLSGTSWVWNSAAGWLWADKTLGLKESFQRGELLLWMSTPNVYKSTCRITKVFGNVSRSI